MSGEKYSSIALVEPMLTTLMLKTLTAVESDTPVVFELKKAALDNLKTRYGLWHKRHYSIRVSKTSATYMTRISD